MGDYTPTTWVDDDGSLTVGTPFSALRMNNIEAGVEDAAELSKQRGAVTSRPAASAANKNWLWTDTDGTLYYSDGTAWYTINGGGGRVMKPVSWAIAVNVNIASPGVTIDGVSPATGERVLLLAQTTTSQNGIYVYNGSAVAMTRSTDAALSTDWKQGSFIPITKGRAGLAGKMARYTNSDNPTIGTTALTFAFQGDYSTVTALPLGIADGQECYYLAVTPTAWSGT
jgi:hypothetical protein